MKGQFGRYPGELLPSGFAAWEMWLLTTILYFSMALLTVPANRHTHKCFFHAQSAFGSCSPISQSPFFSKALLGFLIIPKIVSLSVTKQEKEKEKKKQNGEKERVPDRE